MEQFFEDFQKKSKLNKKMLVFMSEYIFRGIEQKNHTQTDSSE